ncbi:helix-turn-helix transcriptional regulator [Marinospirillum sp. MEB164]|uniref:Helix-turn-helix transcriptional regulator n=1 Tax=Marinospirillum alkalitolerans TaxID=3123374 RepID=A0ABW8Q179_9GAMM
MSRFPVRLRQLRLAAGLTQEQLGFAVEVTKSSVSA